MNTNDVNHPPVVNPPHNAGAVPPVETAQVGVRPVENEKILGKPVFWINSGPLNIKSGFGHKRLCDYLTVTAGTACAYGCEYCYAESTTTNQQAVRDILTQNGKQFNEVVIRRNNAVQHLVQDLTRNKKKNENIQTAEELLTPELIETWGLKDQWSLQDRVAKYRGPEWEGKVIYASPLVDVAPTKELASETVEMCDAILRLTPFHIRLLSKSPILEDVAKQLAARFPDPQLGAKARVIFGLSTGTLDDKVAAAIERHAPSPSARIKALHRLQDNGFRTYGMLCPILPQKDAAAYKQFAQAAMKAIRADKCEEIWAEAVNFRAGGKEPAKNPDDQRQRDSFEATLQALVTGGFQEEADMFELVATDSQAWEQYTRTLFEALVEAVPQQTIPNLILGPKVKAERPNKLWWLQYPQNYASITDYWVNQEVNGAVLLGAVVTRYRKPKKQKIAVAAAPQLNAEAAG